MEHFLAVLVAALLIGALWGALRLYDAYPNFGGLFEIMNSAAR